jgi:hypothetical protein
VAFNHGHPRRQKETPTNPRGKTQKRSQPDKDHHQCHGAHTGERLVSTGSLTAVQASPQPPLTNRKHLLTPWITGPSRDDKREFIARPRITKEYEKKHKRIPIKSQRMQSYYENSQTVYNIRILTNIFFFLIITIEHK